MKILLFLLFSFMSFMSFSQDDEEMVNELVKEKEKQVQAYQKIDQSREAITGAPEKLIEDLKKAGHQNLDMKAVLDPKMVDSLKNMFFLSGIHQLPAEEIRSMILAKVKGSALERVFTKFPKLLDKIVLIIQDREAIPQMMELIKRQDDLKIFFGISVFLFLFSFVLKKLLISKEASFISRFVRSSLIKIGILGISFGAFYFMFQKEIGPVVRVILS